MSRITHYHVIPPDPVPGDVAYATLYYIAHDPDLAEMGETPWGVWHEEELYDGYDSFGEAVAGLEQELRRQGIEPEIASVEEEFPDADRVAADDILDRYYSYVCANCERRWPILSAQDKPRIAADPSPLCHNCA